MLAGMRTLGLLRHLPRLPPPSLPLQPLLRAPFSEFFDRQDHKELKDAFDIKYRKKFLHYKLTDHWQKNLERKQHRK